MLKIRASKKGFSLIELIVVIAIIATLSAAAYIGIQRSKGQSLNDQVQNDLLAIMNGLEQYKKDNNGSYPVPEPNGNMNLNCFFADTSYAHNCASAAFRQGMVDNNLLTKRYLPQVPTDPHTGSRYVYGVSNEGQYFQLAGIVRDENGNWQAKVLGNLARGYHLPSLIRAYDGPDFVLDGESYLPYSPAARVISARLENLSGTIQVNDTPVSTPVNLVVGDTVKTVGINSSVDIYFSDGSVSTLGPGDAEMQILPTSAVEENDADNIITKIRLKLFSGTVWNKVTRLAEKSEFTIETTSSIAGVRGTEFGLSAGGGAGGVDRLYVYSGEVGARQMNTAEIAEQQGSNGSVTFGKNTFSLNGELATAPNANPSDPATDLVGFDIVGSDPVVVPLNSITLPNPASFFQPYEDRGILNNNIRPRMLLVSGDGTKTEVTLANVNRHPGAHGTINDVQIYACLADTLDTCDTAAGLGACGCALADAETDPEDPYVLSFDSSSVIDGLPVLSGGHPIVFAFQMYGGSGAFATSAFSQPAITLDATTRLREVDVYGFVEGDALVLNANPGAGPLCGNGVLDLLEACDGSLFRDASNNPMAGTACSAYHNNGSWTGNMSCTSNCQVDTGNCLNSGPPPGCLDGYADVGLGEECDFEGGYPGGSAIDGFGNYLTDFTCQDIDSTKYSGGVMQCNPGSCRFDASNCVLAAVCGNGVQETGEVCDDGNNIDNDTCTNACALPICGDSIIQTSNGEQCDDGGTTNGDGCSSTCTVEPTPQDICTSGGGYWEGGACWVMGAPAENCTDACSAFAGGGVFSCDAGTDWNDISQTACLGLNSGAVAQGVGANNEPFGPYYIPPLNRCYFRDTGITDFDDPITTGITENICSTTYNITANHQRVCRCI